jgi:hypothetical protein
MKLWVEVCIVCGKISTAKGCTTSSKDCQRVGRGECTWQRHDMTPIEVNRYCAQRGWKPLAMESP